MLEKLKQEVFETNLALVRHGLVTLTWGNASAYDPDTGYLVIKPSGVDYQKMQPEDMVVVDLNGKIIEGKLNPSSDLWTHIVLYKQWAPKIKAIIHTHSLNAVVWAQALKPLPCYGTTHADVFYGPVPLAPVLSSEQINANYEYETGQVILKTFMNKDPISCPGILVSNHGPFCWGPTSKKALEAAVTLETIAEMALKTLQLNPTALPAKQTLQDKHYYRKHGKNATYGQKLV